MSRWDSGKFGYLTSDFVIGYNSANIGAEETMALHKRQELVGHCFYFTVTTENGPLIDCFTFILQYSKAPLLCP